MSYRVIVEECARAAVARGIKPADVWHTFTSSLGVEQKKGHRGEDVPGEGWQSTEVTE